jgi:hypothetical protein
MGGRTRVVGMVGAVLAVVASVTVLPGTAQARPIGCGSVVTRSVVLAHDLLGCQGDGLVIGAGGITVNLAGHTVAGVVSDDSVGIRNAGHPGVVIKNVDDPGTRIVGNTANDNDDLGIEAVAGVTDGGGNSASGNGNPAQCLNISCT